MSDEAIIVKAGDTMVSIAASRGQPSSAICDLAAANPHKEKMPGTCQFRSLYVGEELNTPPNWPCCSGCASGHGGCGDKTAFNIARGYGTSSREVPIAKGLGSCGGNCGQTMGSASGFGNGSPSTTNGPGSYRDGSANYPRTAGNSNGAPSRTAGGSSNGGSGGSASGSSNGGAGGISTTSGHSEGYSGYGSPRGIAPSGSGNGAGSSGSRGIQGLGDTTDASTSYATPLIIGLAALAAGFGLAYVAMRPAKTEKQIREETRRRR
jgi:hypothetical protein